MKENRYEEKYRREQFAANLAEILEAEGMSQAQLAEAMNVPPQYISRWITADSLPRMGTLCQLSDVLGRDIGELIEDPEFQPVEVWADPKVRYADELFKNMYTYDQKTVFHMLVIALHAAYRVLDLPESEEKGILYKGLEYFKDTEDFCLYGILLDLFRDYVQKTKGEELSYADTLRKIAQNKNQPAST